MIRTYLLSETSLLKTGGVELIQEWQKSETAKIWIDIQTDDQAQAENLLLEMQCHPLAIKDTLRKRHPPKIELFKEHIFMLYRGIQNEDDCLTFQHQQIGFFIGERSLISVHPEPAKGIEAVLDADNISSLLQSPFILAFTIMHASAGVYLNSVLEFESLLSDKEDALYEQGNDKLLAELATYKARLVKLKRVFNYHHDMTLRLKAFRPNDLPFDISSAEHTINDLHERFERLLSLAQMHYDICSDMIESYLSIASHQMNVTMRVLTVITAIFVPLGFLAGLYGMNFEFMPELKFRYAYFVLLFIMFFLAISLIILFKRKRWF